MWVERAVIALWFACSAAVAWVWLRPLAEGPLPPPVERQVKPKRLVADVPAGDEEPAAEEPGPSPAPSTQNDHLNRRDLEAAMERVKPQLLACQAVEQYNGLVSVRLVIGRSGAVQSTTVLPPLDNSPTADCLKRALRPLSFPRFRGTYLPTIEWTYTLLFKEGG